MKSDKDSTTDGYFATYGVLVCEQFNKQIEISKLLPSKSDEVEHINLFDKLIASFKFLIYSIKKVFK